MCLLNSCCHNNIKQRWIIAIMGFLSIFNSYTLRTSFTMSIAKMTEPDNFTDIIHSTCQPYGNYTTSNSKNNQNDQIFQWSHYIQGIILSSFYWGYTIAHIPAGILLNKYGAKVVTAISMLLSGLLTILIPGAAFWKGAYAIIVLNFFLGAFQGLTQPSTSFLLARWTPSQERSKIGSLAYSGAASGIVFGAFISGEMLNIFEWPFIFYSTGFFCFVLFFLWILLCYNSPSQHPFISSAEKEFLKKELDGETHESALPIPWKHIIISKPFWALVIMYAASDYTTYTVLSNFPKYIHRILKFPIHITGTIFSLNYIGFLIFCAFMSCLSDKLVNNQYLSRTNVRKMNGTIANLGTSFSLIAAIYSGCNHELFACFFILAFTLRGSWIPALKVNILELSPNHAGTLMGICNGAGSFTGILAPYIVGILTPNQTIAEYTIVCWIVFAVLVISNAIFICFASGDVQKWNEPRIKHSNYQNYDRVHLNENKFYRKSEN